VYNFFIKKMTALHPKLLSIVYQSVINPELIDDEFYKGITYLLAKKDNATSPVDLRPITCLPNIYKLVSKVVTKLTGEICELNDVISANQMGTKQRCQGAKQQALVNKSLNVDHDNELYTSWINVKKAFDSVRHEYLVDCLRAIELPECIIAFVERMLEHQKTSLHVNSEDIGTVRIFNGGGGREKKKTTDGRRKKKINALCNLVSDQNIAKIRKKEK